jgi:hypothetical protein
MRRGRTFSRRSSAGAIPFFGPITIQSPPAVCVADAGRGDWVLCQITSNPYGDPWATGHALHGRPIGTVLRAMPRGY